jgi:hypothetical protein
MTHPSQALRQALEAWDKLSLVGVDKWEHLRKAAAVANAARALLAAPSAPGAQPEPADRSRSLPNAHLAMMAEGCASPSQREAGRELTDDEIDSTLDNAYSAAVKSGKTNGGMVGHLWNHIAARAVIAADRAARGEAGRAIPREPAPELWRHVKTGGVYRWLMSAVKEEDRSILVIYQSEETGVRWVRPSKAFYDGRFVRVTSPTEAPKETPEQFRERMLSHGRELDEAAKTDPLHGAGQKEGGE